MKWPNIWVPYDIINTVKSVQDFTYKNLLLLSKQIDDSYEFIKDGHYLYLVDEILDDQVICVTEYSSSIEFLTKLITINKNKIDFILLIYTNSNKIIILYKDIEFTSNYYWIAREWFHKNYKYIMDYFNNIIDEKIVDSINDIRLDSSPILDIINTYDLPNNRDRMIVRAINKYSSEMYLLLNSINDKQFKKKFIGVRKILKTFMNNTYNL